MSTLLIVVINALPSQRHLVPQQGGAIGCGQYAILNRVSTVFTCIGITQEQLPAGFPIQPINFVTGEGVSRPREFFSFCFRH